jgi:hypothetical protein
MSLVDANGRPLGKTLENAQRRAAQQPQFMGCAVFKVDAKNVLIPAVTPKGDFAIFPNPQVAVDAANQFAQQELRPNAEQKVVTPLMKSSRYVVATMYVVAEIQAQIKDPAQLLAPEGKLNG